MTRNNFVDYQNMSDILNGIEQKISGLGSQLTGVSTWKPDSEYKIGDIAIENGSLFICQQVHTSSVSFESDVDKWILFYADISPWQATTYYVETACVIYKGNLYQCKTAHTSGSEFDTAESTNWLQIPSGLTEEEVEKIIDNFIPSTSENRYTTTERKVGVWIDNKPVYQVTITGTLPSSGNLKAQIDLQDLSSYNIETLVAIDAITLIENNGVYGGMPNASYHSGNSEENGAVYMVRGANSYLAVTIYNNNRWNNKYHVTIKYTKK